MEYAYIRNHLGDIVGVLRLEDMASIPPSEGNADYVVFLEWLAEGGEPGEWPPAE